MSPGKICIVTTRHISYNPRVLKEADAFYSKGYAVTVVTINNHAGQHKFDKQLMQDRKWQLKTVNFRREEKKEKSLWLLLSLKQKFYSFLSRFSYKSGIAERAALKGYDEVLRLAKKEGAGFYLAHHAEALGIAFTAARTHKAKFGFDAEDFHTGMNESATQSEDEKMLEFLERKYLPCCDWLTAASKGIGNAYQNKYGVKVNATVLNVFPKEQFADTIENGVVRFYWYSQVIGPNRSLETLLTAAAQIAEDFELHLRGSFHSPVYENILRTLVNDLNLQHKVFFHPPIVAEEIIADAAQYDVGLALESSVSVNRNICVTNKIFSYLMSGLAIVGTDTSGQKDIFSQFAEAVRICRQNEALDLAAAMRYFIQHPQKLAKAKDAARKAADLQFNWEAESEMFLNEFQNQFLSGSVRKVSNMAKG